MIDPIAMTSLAELSGNVGFGLVTIGAASALASLAQKPRKPPDATPELPPPLW